MLGVNHEAQAASMNRVAASSALRSVILAATACSGAANAASSAAEELAELRANFRRNAEARRSNSAPYLSLSRMKERDPEGLAKVQENGQAAQDRADRALAQHRLTRQKLRVGHCPNCGEAYEGATRTCYCRPEVRSPVGDLDRSRKDIASAIAKTAEVRTELAASQLELTEEQQAKRKLGEHAESLNQLIRKTQAEAALLRDQLASARASEAAEHGMLREELHGLRSEAFAESEEAEQAKKAARELLAACAEAQTSSEAAWQAHEAEAASCTSLRRSLKAAEDQLHSLNHRSSTQQAAELMLLRREKAARRQLSSLLACLLEDLLRRSFGAWRQSKAARLREEQAEEAVQQRRELRELRAELAAASSCPECGSIYLADAMFCRHCGRKREADVALTNETEEAERLRRELELLQHELGEEQSRKSEAVRLRQELEEQQRAERRSLQLQEELRDARIGLEVLRDELQQARSSEERSLAGLQKEQQRKSEDQAHELQEVRASLRAELQRVRDATESCGRLETELGDARRHTASARAELREAREAEKAQAEAAPVASLELSLAHLAGEAASLKSELEEEQLKSRQLEKAFLAKSCAGAAESATCTALARREEASRRVLAGLLAAHLETALRLALRAWRQAAENQRAEALRAELQELRAKSVAAQTQLAAAGEQAKQVEPLREELAELRRKSSVAQAQLEAAGEQAKEVESLRAELTELRQESAVAKTQLEAAGEQAKEVESLRAELTELRQKSAVAKTHLEAAEEQAKEVESLRAELTELRQKSAVAQTQLEAAGEQAKKVESLRTELTELRQKSAVAQARLEAAGEQAKKVESLRAELQELKHKPEVDQEALRAKDRAAAVAELHGQATHAALSRREEASRRCFASQLAAHYEQLLVLALRAWRGATAQELSLRDAAAEVEQLRREMQGLKQDLAHKAQPSKVVEPEAADFVWQFLEAPNPLPDVVAGASTETVGLPKPTDFAESAVQLALLRREEAQRRLLASLLSSQLVAVLSLAFRAWQNAQDASGMERQALLQKDELQKLRTQLEQQKEAPSALRYLHRAFAAWREDQAAEALERLAAQHARELELQRAELARPTENEATQRLTRAADTRAMQEEAERERLLLVSFLTWREDKVANAATLAAQRHGREMDRLRTQLQSQTAGLSDCTPESREEKRLRAELAELKSREEAFILQTQRDKEAEKAALCDRAAELAMARREEAARGLLSSLLAWRLESLLSDAFGAWQSLQGARKREEQSREVAELRSALQAAQTSNLRREEARLREEQSKEVAELRSKLSATTPAGDEAAREAAESSRFALEEMAVALFYQQRAGAMSKALSFALCGQLELFLAGAFLEWRRAVLDERKGRQRAVSLESVEQFIAPPHAPNQLAVPAASPSPSRSSSKNEAARWEDWDMDPDYEPEL